MKYDIKKLLVIAPVALCMSSFAHASAQDTGGVYVAGKIGASIQNVKDQDLSFPATEDDPAEIFSFGSGHKTAFGGGVALGYDFSAISEVPVRVELDYTARANAKNSKSATFADEGKLTNRTKVQLQTVMANVYYDIDTGTAWTPYVDGGIGFAHIKLDQRADSSDDTGDSRSGNKNRFAWGLGAGVAYAIDTNWTVDMSYRYLNAGKVEANLTDPDGTTSKAQAKVDAHDVMLAVRYTF
ncbi:porin family protein [Salmonella enterica]|nr:porin family protein [Salmonella enterica]